MSKNILLIILSFILFFSVTIVAENKSDILFLSKIQNNALMNRVDSMAKHLVSTGFNAGDGYGEVWIRDLNTFIELSMDVMSYDDIQSNLNTFFFFKVRKAILLMAL